MSQQKVEVARSMSCGHELEGAMHEKFDGDSSSVWQIFNRQFIYLRGGSSVTVLFDEQRTKSKLAYNLRVRCIYCAGAASNRGLCSYEKNA